MSILFKNCRILSRKDGKYEVVKGYLGVEGEYIDYIGTGEPAKKYDDVKDMKHKLLMPGLVNAHGHSSMVLLRGAGSGLPLDDWLFGTVVPIENRMCAHDIYVGNKMAVLEMLAGGTTQISDMYDYPFAGIMAYAESGIKANTTRTGLCTDPNASAEEWPRTAQSIGFIDILRGNAPVNDEFLSELPQYTDVPDILKEAVQSGRLTPQFMLHSEYLSTDAFNRAIAEANKTRKTVVGIHVSETRKEHFECIDRHGKTPVAYFEEMGILDNPAYLAHCVWVNAEDLQIMKRKNATLVHCPSSNLKLGSGIAPVAGALAMGVRVALGTDGAASNNNLNMFEEMHLAGLLQKGYNSDPTLVSDSAVVDMATVNGSIALGRSDSGTLEVGKKADIIALDTDKPHWMPNMDTLAMLVYSAQAGDVCMTMVDGKILYENGEYLTLDKDRVIYEFRQSFGRLK